MNWYDATNKKDPTSCNGEYRLNLSWLNHSVNDGAAYYSVNKDFDGSWYSTFWHGNRGYVIANELKNISLAKGICIEHMKDMYLKFTEQINGIQLTI